MGQTETKHDWQCSDVDAAFEAGVALTLEEVMEFYMHLHFCHGACSTQVLEKMETGELAPLLGVHMNQLNKQSSDE